MDQAKKLFKRFRGKKDKGEGAQSTSTTPAPTKTEEPATKTDEPATKTDDAPAPAAAAPASGPDIAPPSGAEIKAHSNRKLANNTNTFYCFARGLALAMGALIMLPILLSTAV